MDRFQNALKARINRNKDADGNEDSGAKYEVDEDDGESEEEDVKDKINAFFKKKFARAKMKDAEGDENDSDGADSTRNNPFSNMLNNFSQKMKDIKPLDAFSKGNVEQSLLRYQLHIVLVNGDRMTAKDSSGWSDCYVIVEFDKIKKKSSIYRSSLNPIWKDKFVYYPRDVSGYISFSVFDYDLGNKDDLIGSAYVNIAELKLERTHRLNLALEDADGSLNVMITITGTNMDRPVSMLERALIEKRYGGWIPGIPARIEDVGWLQVHVIRARNLPVADLRSSDPYVVLDLVNEHRRTRIIEVCVNPVWNSVFQLMIKDIHSILDVQVFDSDRNTRDDLLGRVLIPILQMRRNIRRWYVLKDRQSVFRHKGEIQLMFDYTYSPLKAFIKTFKPMEESYLSQRKVIDLKNLMRNINKLSKLARGMKATMQLMRYVLDWQNAPLTLFAWFLFTATVFFVEIWMLVFGLVGFAVYVVYVSHRRSLKRKEYDYDYDTRREAVGEVEIEEDLSPDDDVRGNLITKYRELKDQAMQLQDSIRLAAELPERLNNFASGYVPWLANTFLFVAIVLFLAIYFIDIRFLIIGLGIKMFSKKMINRKATSNNELLDFISRLPVNLELISYRDLAPLRKSEAA